ncbi:hypothetical protein [Flavobacterium daemonense]|uniref:hypothetical protein n=1 Tax=Flavobacterium daemonense TaxID=1393049 RepID=UPI0011869074|nr:hypothetical protein [Flavobacterium daemonense]KAF2329088.1 hypothetical protein FND99_17315 [Flavobacterium daemonense]KAF2329089.1 hypothetical protein FND99_17320 [Flavobacterium daemonense]
MKKLSLKNATNFLSRKEMKSITGGYGDEGGYGPETCFSYDACPSGCIERTATTSGWSYRCNTCCIA